MRWVQSPAGERVHRRIKETAVNDLVNRKTDKTMEITRRANRKAPDKWLHGWRQDKGATHKTLSRSILYRSKAMRIVRQVKIP